ncbi:hypothetical protein TRIUR3_09151 [Triticum urartu]|uniref:Uncharacterized protein n=1 Tax=Triticum urartu TaxID=4572 RepID=M8AFY2_TRIUA|nr:hypothetical protein TRIUR3_09151 [Triticum urartu]
MAVMESANLDAAEKKVTTVENDGLSLMARQHTKQTKAVRKKVGRGWDPTYTRRSFFSTLEDLAIYKQQSTQKELCHCCYWCIQALEGAKVE